MKEMQDKSKILYKTIGKLVNKIRQEKGIRYIDFCYGNDIPTSTYDYIVNASTQASFYNIARIIKALGLNFEEFGALLDKNLPQEYWNEED